MRRRASADRQWSTPRIRSQRAWTWRAGLGEPTLALQLGDRLLPILNLLLLRGGKRGPRSGLRLRVRGRLGRDGGLEAQADQAHGDQDRAASTAMADATHRICSLKRGTGSVLGDGLLVRQRAPLLRAVLELRITLQHLMPPENVVEPQRGGRRAAGGEPPRDVVLADLGR
jgi:hypothetical protein